MTDTTIPVLTFNQGKAQDIPFEIFRVEGKSEYPVVPFRQTFYGIAVVTEGAGKNHIDFHAYPIETGTVYFISPGQVQRWEPARQVNGYVLL
ncbi:MAG: AraC family ligand binding domain-containing protein, partial [Chloroflexota bacterium]